MKKLIAVLVVAVPMLALGAGKAEACKVDGAKFEKHLGEHITYPTTGKDVKAACKKEMPEEFTAEERTCFESKVKDGAKFKDVAALKKVLGV